MCYFFLNYISNLPFNFKMNPSCEECEKCSELQRSAALFWFVATQFGSAGLYNTVPSFDIFSFFFLLSSDRRPSLQLVLLRFSSDVAPQLLTGFFLQICGFFCSPDLLEPCSASARSSITSAQLAPWFPAATPKHST